MLKNFKKISIFAFVICILSSCSSYYYNIKSDIPKGLTLNNYQTINLGWVDINENMWKELEYEEANKNVWINLIQDFNKICLVGYLKGYYKEKEINPPVSKNEISKKPGLNITFSNVKFIKGGTKNALKLREQGKLAMDHIEATLHFADSSTGKEIYKIDVISYSYGAIMGYGLEKNIDNCAANLALIIKKIIKD